MPGPEETGGRREAERGAERELAARGGAAIARELLRKVHVGVLATISTRQPGHPFQSLAPFALTREGEPILLVSAIAQHSRNLEADPRASLFVHDPAPGEKDPRAAARTALVGRVRRVPSAEEPDVRARYLARHPDARALLGLDFSLHVLAVEEVQVVGGFGAAGWVPGGELREPV